MKTSHLFALIISIFLVSLFAIFGFVTSSLFGKMCGFSITNDVLSENFTASTLSRGCGVGSEDYAFVNVRTKGESVEDEDELSEKQVFLTIESENEKIYWKDDRTLVIDCSDCLIDGLEKANSYVKKRFNHLKIEYKNE